MMINGIPPNCRSAIERINWISLEQTVCQRSREDKTAGLQWVWGAGSLWGEVHTLRLSEQVVCAISKNVVYLQRCRL
jgi:hypothetical protein